MGALFGGRSKGSGGNPGFFNYTPEDRKYMKYFKEFEKSYTQDSAMNIRDNVSNSLTVDQNDPMAVEAAKRFTSYVNEYKNTLQPAGRSNGNVLPSSNLPNQSNPDVRASLKDALLELRKRAKRTRSAEAAESIYGSLGQLPRIMG